jgi:UDP-N-acetylglucosamine 4-epimerase
MSANEPTAYERLLDRLPNERHTWLVTGVAGFNRDAETSRDFCFVANAVQVNLVAATAEGAEVRNQVYNVAVSDRTTLSALFALLREHLSLHGVPMALRPVYRDFRAGDVRHSQANVEKAARFLGYMPTHGVAEGIAQAMPWYFKQQALSKLVSCKP